MTARRRFGGAICGLSMIGLLLAACAPTPMNPTVQATPGRAKTPEMFLADTTACKGVAQDAVKGQDQAAQPPPAAAGVPKTPPPPPTVQQQYDTAFSKCMFAKGEQVPGYAAPAAPQARILIGPDTGLVRATQTELIRLRYFAGAADGVMGPMTGTAIRNFEQASGLPADGTVSAILLARLQSTPTAAAAPAATPAASTAPAGWVQPKTQAP